MAVVWVVLATIPSLAQDDFPRFEVGTGYGFVSVAGSVDDRFSGLNLYADVNLTDWFGFENLTAYYPGPNDTSLTFSIIGPKVTARRIGRLVPYGVAGVGIGFSRTIFGDANLRDLRVGGGVDVPFREIFALRLDISRLWFRANQVWIPGSNVSVGIVFNLVLP